ncbi:MAG: AAA family ATPase [bacterium]|nr:AAA family ATPase [bacterium]
MGKIIAFANQKGGVGKTTTCVNVSAYLAKMGKKVLLIDIDPQGNATSGLGLKKSRDIKSIYNVIVGDIEPKEAIVSTKIENLDIIPTNIDLAGVEVEMVYMENRERILEAAFNKVKDNYDYVTIDCPPSLGLLTINAFVGADSVLVPIQCEFFALEGLSQLMNTIRLVKKKLNDRLNIDGVVLTMRDTRSNLGKLVGDEINKYFGGIVYETTIPRNVKLAEAPSFGMPICLYDKNCAGAKAYIKLTEEFLTRKHDNFNKL